MCSRNKFSLEDVNKMDYNEFREHFGSVIYGTLAATTVWKQKPFRSFHVLHQAFVRFLQLLNPEAKEGLIRCHPDLTGKLLELRSLSKYSQAEQKSAGLHALNEEEADELEELNTNYRQKFKFTFIVCVRENTKNTIFSSLKSRLQNEHMVEVEHALVEISKIAFYRLESLVHHQTTSKL